MWQACVAALPHICAGLAPHPIGASLITCEECSVICWHLVCPIFCSEEVPPGTDPMLARLLIGFLAVIVPSTVLLGGVTFHSLTSLDRVNRDLVQIMHSRAAVADLRPTLTQVGAPLGAYMLGGDVRNRARFEELISAAEDKLQSCALGPCHVSIRTPENMAQALRPVIERVKALETEGKTPDEIADAIKAMRDEALANLD